MDEIDGQFDSPSEHGGRTALAKLSFIFENSLREVAPILQLPEPVMTLNLAARRDSELRQFKHIHQSCILHWQHFCRSSQIKHLHLMDAYLTLAESGNGYALYLVARSMFEMNAFLHEVHVRLSGAAERSKENWTQAGQVYFGTIVRARFATTREDFAALLREEGVSKDNMKPLNVMNCIRNLADAPGFVDAEERYALLCDYVHHNLASATTANAGTGEGNLSVNSQGGGIITPATGPITQYQYPIPSKYELALEETAPGFHRDVLACIRWINETPGSPFSPSLVEKHTGSAIGMEVIRNPTRISSPPAVGRNDPCPCGSGVKYKRCCGTA